MLILVSDPNQTNELSALDADDDSVSPDSSQDIWRLRMTAQSEYLIIQCLDNPNI